jgi:D-tagatose-1,6-bisphosphate aldolase subunit GatZ/KbaZ
MTEVLRDIIARNRAGDPVAIPSVCSAQPDVIRASLNLAQTLDRAVVIEATSNQVNQDGGYTGMTAAGFRGFVQTIADRAGLDRDRIIFGGDHLGPQAWRSFPADAAMAKARALVRDYVAAGFGKIHLDCSEGCADEAAQLTDDETAERSAELAQVCAQVSDDLLFVVGTEVPPPGGARVDEHGVIAPTRAAAARTTLQRHIETFGDLAGNIGGLVVQPGVEFGPSDVHHMPMDRDPGFVQALAEWPTVCLEAHSTDFQNAAVFPRLAQLGFAFQKVGPALTFAHREALYGLDALCDTPALRDVMEAVMIADPSHWQGHYHGPDAAALRHDGLADRIRYYWLHPDAQAAVAHVRGQTFTDAALSKQFAPAILDRAAALSGDAATRIIDAHIQAALAPYFF